MDFDAWYTSITIEHWDHKELMERAWQASALANKRKPLTRERVDELADDYTFTGNVYEITKAIEQEHGISA